MEDYDKIKSALYAIDPSSLSYDEWRTVGMALKSEGESLLSLWDDWSAQDQRPQKGYHPGLCAEKWATFNGSGITVASLFSMAHERGWEQVRRYDWGEEVDTAGLVLDADGVIAQHIPPDPLAPWQQLQKFLETLFKPDEFVSFVTHSELDEDGKWKPANGGRCLKVSKMIANLKRYEDVSKVIGDWTPEGGAWIRVNPCDGEGGSKSHITRWDYALVECDGISIEEQKKAYIRLNLPIKTLVLSGSRSLHAIVRIDASSPEEYKQRTELMFSELGKQGLQMDIANKDESRLSRLPGVTRKGVEQSLVATDIGTKSWNEWRDFMAGINDNLPQIETLGSELDDPPILAPELIQDVLRIGNKMLITGDSKSGKTCLTQELAIAIAEGWEWLGHKCMQGKVLYINLEVTPAGLYARFLQIYKEYGKQISEEGKKNLCIWNLRGHVSTLNELAPKIIRRCRSEHYAAIIIDPIYKVQGGDENSASEIGRFCNQLDYIARETGASPIFNHHHAKGFQGDKKAIDRGSGSGVFARDPDAIVDLSVLDPDKDIVEMIDAASMSEDAIPMQASFILRDFRSPKPVNMFFLFPLHVLDSARLLDGAAVEGSRAANLQKSPKRTGKEERRQVLDDCFGAVEYNGSAKFSEMWKSPVCQVSDKTLRRYLEEFSDDYTFENGIVRKD